MTCIPRKFFEEYVKPAYEEWEKDRLEMRLAMSVFQEANNVADYMYNYWKSRDPSKVYGTSSPGRYRDELARTECGAFGLLRDIAEGHKHVELSRDSRKVTRADQKGKQTLGGGYSSAPFSTVPYSGSHSYLIVVTDDGKEMALTEIIRPVMQMWERLLDQMCS